MKQLTFSLIAGILFLSSCNDSFLKSDLEKEDLGPCTGETTAINVESNVMGQRYEYQECIDADFDGATYSVTRSGDSIFVNFPQTEGKQKKLYKLKLDIDAKPGYRHIIFNGRHVEVSASTF